MALTRFHPIIVAARQGAWFGFKASLAIFGGVFMALMGGAAAWWLYVRLAQGAAAAGTLIEEEGGARALQHEVWIAAGRVMWLVFCCTLFSALVFAVCAALSDKWHQTGDADAPHPLDR